MSRVVIGMDPHKRSATIEAINEQEEVLAGGRFGTDAEGYQQMLAAGRAFTDRVWAVEGCYGIGRHIAQRLHPLTPRQTGGQIGHVANGGAHGCECPSPAPSASPNFGHPSDTFTSARSGRRPVQEAWLATVRGPRSKAARLAELLLAESNEFARCGTNIMSERALTTSNVFIHPELGVVALDCQSLLDPGQSHRLLVYTAVPGSESYDKLKLLSVIAAQPFQAIPVIDEFAEPGLF